MAQQNAKLADDSSAPEAQDNLVSMQDSGKEKQVMEINKQMTALESSISTLTKKLNTTNKQVKSDVDRLTTSDAEISEKVADTYKQLAEIETTFFDLNKQSNEIRSDLKTVNKTIRAFEKSSTEALNKAVDNQSEINEGFKQQHEDIIKRAEKLSKNAKTISTKLTKSIEQNSKALTELEAKIVAELESLAKSSQTRDDKLDDRINSSNKEISSQKAKMLLMQSVDEALDKRAASLEETSAILIKDSQSLKNSTEVLDVLTSKLSADVEALELHTAQLAQQNIEQQGQIDVLQKDTVSITRTLLALATLEKKHFKVLAGGSLLLVLAVIASFFYGEYARNTEQTVEIQRNEVINEQVTNLQNKVEDEQMASQVFYSEILELQSNLNQVKTELQVKTEQINAEIVEMNDQVESLDGRVQYLAPLYNFGSDNTIHGSQWLSSLDKSKMSIKIGTVADKQGMYEIAQRYNHYFTEELAYFKTADDKFTLIYGGNFNDQKHIDSTLRKMPRYINHELIGSISNTEILQQIKK